MRTHAILGLAAAAAVGLAALAGAASAQYYEGVDSGFPAPTGDAGVLPPGAKLMRLFDGGCILTEGVAAGHDGFMYFSDITFTKFCADESGLYAQADESSESMLASGQAPELFILGSPAMAGLIDDGDWPDANIDSELSSAWEEVKASFRWRFRGSKFRDAWPNMTTLQTYIELRK